MADNTIRSLGIALAAGFAGTAAMTLSQAIEQRLTGQRRPRTAASVAENATGMETETEEGRESLSSGLHWLYGTGLGAALVPLDGISEPMRSLTFLGGVYGAGLALESMADQQDAPSKKDATQFGADFVHHLVYAGTATLAYNGLKAAMQGDDDAGSTDALFSSWGKEGGSSAGSGTTSSGMGGSGMGGATGTGGTTTTGTGVGGTTTGGTMGSTGSSTTRTTETTGTGGV
jgi:hypothetical protein